MGQQDSAAGDLGARAFRVWVRRTLDATSPFSLRFEAGEGKGMLRVTRPGVLIDPPARPSGEEVGLTAAQVRASRFLHVREGGKGRVSFLLQRLEDAALERLPLDRWAELQTVADGSARFLSLLGHLPLVDADSPVDEPTSPQRMLAELEKELSHPGRSVPDPEEHTPVAPTSSDPSADAELADWAPAYEIRDAARPAPALVVETTTEEEEPVLATEGDEDEEDDVELEPPLAAAPEPAPVVDLVAFHQRNTTLVRFLRRRLVAEEQRVRLLEAEMRALQARARPDPG